MTKNHLTFIDAPIKQLLSPNILVLVQETPFIDSRHKEINRLLKKGVFTIIIDSNVL